MAPPTDAHELLHWNMVHAHETFKNGYESILSHLDDPPMKDLKNFVGYCEAWAVAIDDHHNAEEDVVFPFLQKKLDFSGELEQHKVLHAGLDELLAVIHAAQADYSKFDAQQIKSIMQKLRPPLYQHLDEETVHVSAKNLEVFSAKELLELDANLEKWVKNHGDPAMGLPYMRSHTPPEHKEEWPPLPWLLRKVLIPYVFALKYSGYWKYSPYSM